MTLRDATRHLHHACEAHPLGQRMVRGEVSAQQWADWLGCFEVMHRSVDGVLPLHFQRGHLLAADFQWLQDQFGAVPRVIGAAQAWADRLETDTDRLGAAYVLHGAHRKGGPVLRKVLSLVGLPSAHTHYDRPADADRLIHDLAGRIELAEAACGTFGALLRCMDDIAGGAL